MIDYQKKERRSYIRFIGFMIRSMNMHQLRRTPEEVNKIYKTF